MTLTDELDKLFEPHIGNNFFPDGIIDEDKYLSAKYKILFLLKDVNTEDENGWDLREIVRNDMDDDGKLYQTSKGAAKYAYLILNDFADYEKLKQADDTMLLEALTQTAMVNLKKTAGKGINLNQTKYEQEVYSEAEKNFDLWKSEMDIIKPDIAICGGTYWIVKDLFVKNNLISADDLKETPSGLPYFEYNNSIFIDFFHPIAKVKVAVAYSHLKLGLEPLLKPQN